jgi:ribosomal protein L32
MRNESPEPARVEERIRSLGADLFDLLPLPDAEVCAECGESACTHASTLYSGGTEPPIPGHLDDALTGQDGRE